MSVVQNSKKSAKSYKAAVSNQSSVVSDNTASVQDVNTSTVDVKVQTKRKAKTTEVVEQPVQLVQPGQSEQVAVPQVEANTVVQPVSAVSAVRVVAPDTTVEAVSTSVPSVETEEQSDDSFETYEDVQKALSEVDKDIVSLNRRRVQLSRIAQKKHTQLSKQHKRRSKGDGKSSKRSVSGFNKPARVPSAFCKYLNLEEGAFLPRTNITALLYKDIKDKKLHNEANKREIIPTPELRALLLMKEGENLKFENFQHYVSRVYKADSLCQSTVVVVDGTTTDGGSGSAAE